MIARNIWALPGYILFFLMLFAPISYKPLKIVLILVVLLVITVSIFGRKNEDYLPINKRIFWLTWFFTGIGLFFMLIGVFRGNPGALTVGTVHVLWPWLYLIFISGISREESLKKILKVMVFATISIELYALSYVYYMQGVLPSFLYIELDLGQNIGFYYGYTEFALNSIGSLVFLLPFVVAALVTWTSEKEVPVKRVWLWVSLLLGCLVLFLSGRRAFMLTTALSPFVLLSLAFFLPKFKRKRVYKTFRNFAVLVAVFAIAGFTYLKTVINYDFSLYTTMISSAFEFSDSSNQSAYARKMQTEALLDGWQNSPLVGNGLGAVAEVVRSEEMPWSYELQYFAYLFQTGMLGILLYGYGIIWIFIQGIKIIKSKTVDGIFIIPVLVGLACFLIANSSNPYLNKYDFIWVIFLPLAFINKYLIHGGKSLEDTIDAKKKVRRYRLTWRKDYSSSSDSRITLRSKRI